MHVQELLGRQEKLWQTANDPQRCAAIRTEDLDSEFACVMEAWTALIDPQSHDLHDESDSGTTRMDLREYLRALLLLATRVRERWSLVDRLPRETFAAIVEYVAANADDGDGPSEAYSLALQLSPDDADLRTRMISWVEEAGGYVCSDGFEDIAAIDPKHAAIWQSYSLLSTYAQYCSWKNRDDAALMLVEILQRDNSPPLADVRELAAQQPWSLPLPGADDWELIESFLES